MLHKTVTDWLTGEAPFDKRSSEDAFFVARDAAHRRLARACARAVRAGVLDTESHSSDAAADAVLASFVEGEGGVASDAYALRWCLFHMKRSNNESEAVAVACSLVVRAETGRGGDIVSIRGGPERSSGSGHVAAVATRWCCRGRRCRRARPCRAVLAAADAARADAESSPAARRLADDAKRVASKLPLSAVRSMLTAAGGAERCRIEVGREVAAWRRSWIRRRASRGLLVPVNTTRSANL